VLTSAKFKAAESPKRMIRAAGAVVISVVSEMEQEVLGTTVISLSGNGGSLKPDPRSR